MKKNPDFVIAGGPKCATTALYSYLKGHPDIFMPETKEPHYFADDIPGDFGRIETAQDYEALFLPSADDQITGEASVMYMASQCAIKNLLRYNPQAKVIVMLRNPVDMAQSLHNQSVRMLSEDETDFEKAWDLQGSREKGTSPVPAECTRLWNVLYRKICSLGSQLERLSAIVPPQQLLILFYDDLKRDPKAVYHDTLRFLELSDDGREDFAVVNRRGELRSKNLQRFIRNPPKILTWLKPLLNGLGIRPLKILYEFNRKPQESKPLTPEFRKKLYHAFEEDIRTIENITGRDLSHWN